MDFNFAHDLRYCIDIIAAFLPIYSLLWNLASPQEKQQEHNNGNLHFPFPATPPFVLKVNATEAAISYIQALIRHAKPVAMSC